MQTTKSIINNRSIKFLNNTTKVEKRIAETGTTALLMENA